MNHLLVSREFPPAPYAAGGIGTYVANIARLLAERGEMVHVIGQQWEGASLALEERCGGRLVIHRIPVDEPAEALRLTPSRAAEHHRVLSGLVQRDFPPQAFAWQAALLAEQLHDEERIDVIEGQDWEAPLYYLQIRRALGLVTGAQAPCFVHLHSPTELIFRYNEWDVGRPDYLPAKRCEDYTIAAADALLCPSRYLARQLQAHFGLSEGRVQIARYPVGALEMFDRSPRVWSDGSICYVGRLEPRKGVLEWVDAAVEVAPEYPDAVFDLVGADLPYRGGWSVRQALEHRIPDALRARFRFHGAQPRERLSEFLARARAAVVPSRWENFPHACIEAMGSGLPVIASREGGMVEMIEDGRTGWLADAPGTAGLVSVLRRALDASASERAAMGRAAADAIRVLSDDEATVVKHLEFREAVARAGASRSLHLPRNLPRARDAVDDPRPGRVCSTSAAEGVALVVVASGGSRDVDACLDTIERQEETPAGVVIVTTDIDPTTAERAARRGWILVGARGPDVAALRNAGLGALRSAACAPLGVSFLDARDRLAPVFVGSASRALKRCPGLGLVSFWTRVEGSERLEAPPCPAFPYQWLWNDAASGAVFRTEALEDVGGFRPSLPADYADWDVVNAVMAAGWTAVTYPAPLLERVAETSGQPTASPPHGALRARLLSRFPEAVARDGVETILLLEAASRRASRELAPVSISADIETLVAEGLALIGRGEDARPLLDALGRDRAPELSAGAVADAIFRAAPLTEAGRPDGWVDLWPTLELGLDDFLVALEERSGSPFLARRTRRELERLVLEAARQPLPLTVGQTHAVRVEVTAPIPAVEPPPGCERLLCAIDVEGDSLGRLSLPICDGRVPADVLADCIAARFAWPLLGRFFERSVYPTLERREGAGERGETATTDEFHERVGWTVFLQELWGQPDWPRERFYDPAPPPDAVTDASGREGVSSDAAAPAIRPPHAPAVVEASASLPNLDAGGSTLPVLLTVGGVGVVMAWIEPDEAGLVRPEAIRAALTGSGGFELCVAAVRGGLLGAPLQGGGTLRTRLGAAAARHTTHSGVLPDLEAMEGVVSGPGSEAVGRAVADGVSILLPRRSGPPSTSVSRRARLPGAAADALRDAAATAGEAALQLSRGGSVAYAPDFFPWPHGPPVDTAPPAVLAGSPTSCLPILMYRSVAPTAGLANNRYRVSPAALEAQLRYLRDAGFQSVTLDDWRRTRERWEPLPGRAALITFDGGYRDFGEHAWPLLKRFGFAATVFVATERVGEKSPRDEFIEEPVPLLDWQDIRRLADEGVSFGSLTATHPDLTALSPETVVREVAGSRATLLSHLAGPITALAYPYGAEDEATQHLVGACGFLYGLSTRPGPAPLTDPLLAMSRIEVRGGQTLQQFIRALGPL